MDSNQLAQILAWCIQHFWQILLALGLCVEVTPIKISPFTWIGNLLFKSIRKEMEDMKKKLSENIDTISKDLKEEINGIKEQQDAESKTIEELIKSNEMTEISRIRWEIIEFSNSIENGQLHIRDEYRHIIDDHKRYHDLIKKYDLTNGVIDEEFEKINRHYEETKESSSVYI